jgi:hypothetical protein
MHSRNVGCVTDPQLGELDHSTRMSRMGECTRSRRRRYETGLFALCSILGECRRLEVERTVSWDGCCGWVVEVLSMRLSACSSPFSAPSTCRSHWATSLGVAGDWGWAYLGPKTALTPLLFLQPFLTLSMSRDVDRRTDDVEMSSRRRQFDGDMIRKVTLRRVVRLHELVGFWS